MNRLMRSRKLLAILAVASSLALVSCWGSDDRISVEGLNCVEKVGDFVTVSRDRASGLRYGSQDGGLTWKPAGPFVDQYCEIPAGRRAGDTFTIYAGSQYLQFKPADGIYSARARVPSSSDAWQLEYDLSSVTASARIAGLRRQLADSYGRDYRVIVEPGPFDAAHDPETGNVVVAMGHDGLLIRSNRDWEWVPVGPYHLHDVSRVRIYSLSWPLLLLPAALLFLLTPAAAYGVASGPWSRKPIEVGLIRAVLVLSMIGLAQYGWHFVTRLTMDKIENPGDISACVWLFLLSFPAAGVLILIGLARLFMGDRRGVIRDSRTWSIIGYTAIAALTVPFALWAEGILGTAESAVTAMVISQMIVLAVAAGYLWRHPDGYGLLTEQDLTVVHGMERQRNTPISRTGAERD